MKFKVEGYTGPNTAFGKDGKIMARVPVNVLHPAIGQELEIDDSQTRKPTEADLANMAAKSALVKPEAVKVPDSEPPKK